MEPEAPAEPALPVIPEGFVLDEASGWYYQSAMAENEQGQPEQRVTYYDAETGTYTQAVYPVEPEAPAEIPALLTEESVQQAESAVPEGFTLDETSGWYYQSTVVRDAQGLPEPTLVYYNPQNGAYVSVPQEERQPSDTPSARTAMEGPMPPFTGQAPKQTATTKAEPTRAARRKKGVAALVAVALLMALGGVGYALDWHKKVPFLAAMGHAASQASESAASVQPTPASTVLEAATTDPQGAEGQGEPTAGATNVSTEAVMDWAEQAHCSYLYSSAKEDDTSIYFLPDAGYARAPSRLCRMKKDGTEVESILDLSVEEGSSVVNFALLGDFIYYNVPLTDAYYGYFRIPKAGGNAQLLFVDEYSNLVAHDGKLYFLFTKRDALGVMDPTVETTPQFTELFMIYNDRQYVPAFSVVDGFLYFGVVSAREELYCRFDLATHQQTELLSSNMVQSTGIRNPFFYNGAAYYVQMETGNGVAYWRSLAEDHMAGTTLSQASCDTNSGSLLCGVRLGDRALYQYESEFRLAPLDALDQYTVVYTGDRPFAVAGNWLFHPDNAVTLDGAQQLYYQDIPLHSLGDAATAYQQGYDQAMVMAVDSATPTPTKTASPKPSATPKATATKKPATKDWVDNTGYKPKYFSWDYETMNSWADITDGKWVSKDGKTVAYLFYDSTPDALDFEIRSNGKTYHGWAEILQDGNTTMAQGYDVDVSFHFDRKTGRVIMFLGSKEITLKLIRAR